MNYVVFDLEWNQCPNGRDHGEKQLPFEIIEIGAVRLGTKDSFHQVIIPRVYKRLSSHTKKIVTLTNRDLQNGRPFPETVRRFLKWAGKDAVFCTWGESDLTELQRNMNYYQMLHMLPGPFPFFDVQRLFAAAFDQAQCRRSLEYAVDFLGIDKTKPFHSAFSDAYYTAEVLKRIDPEYFRKYESIDTYQNPKRKTDEIFTAYETHSVFISREFDTKEALMRDPELRATPCCICGKKTRRKICWFSANTKRHYCIAKCKTHGWIKGEIRVCHNDEGRFFGKKTLRMCDDAAFVELKERKRQLKEKRRKKEEKLT